MRVLNVGHHIVDLVNVHIAEGALERFRCIVHVLQDFRVRLRIFERLALELNRRQRPILRKYWVNHFVLESDNVFNYYLTV